MQTNMDKSLVPTPDKNNNQEASLVGAQWLVGALITLIPIIIVIYFIFFWEPDHTTDDTGSVENEVTSIAPREVQPALPEAPVIPVIPEPRTHVAAQPKPEPETASPPHPAPAQTKKTANDLPTLDQSDDQVLEDLASLSSLLEWYIWLYTDEVVRKFVTVIDNIAEGKIATKHISIPQPTEGFKVTRNDTEQVFLDPASYSRYRIYADTFDALNNADLVRIYWRYFPLMEEAYAELGYADDRKFHDTMISAIDNLLAAPVVNDQIELMPLTPVLYKFADPSLEALPGAYKQLIRMGPRNSLIILRKLEQIKAVLSTRHQSTDG